MCGLHTNMCHILQFSRVQANYMIFSLFFFAFLNLFHYKFFKCSFHKFSHLRQVEVNDEHIVEIHKRTHTLGLDTFTDSHAPNCILRRTLNIKQSRFNTQQQNKWILELNCVQFQTDFSNKVHTHTKRPSNKTDGRTNRQTFVWYFLRVR